MQASLKTLQAAGADAVVTMMPDAELSEFKADSLPAECAALGLAWFQLPVEDDCAPKRPLPLPLPTTRQICWRVWRRVRPWPFIAVAARVVPG